jgi:hypothetical protein
MGLTHVPSSFFETLYCHYSINGPEHIAHFRNNHVERNAAFGSVSTDKGNQGLEKKAIDQIFI